MDEATFFYRKRPPLETARTHPLRKTMHIAPPREFPWTAVVAALTLTVSLGLFGVLFPWAEYDRLAGRGDTTWQWNSLQREVAAKRVSAHFPICLGKVRTTCVANANTIWLEGAEIRVTDIDAPRIGKAACQAERDAGILAATRLEQWLAAGAFDLLPNPDGPQVDDSGRKLRVLSRGGTSAADMLVAEGLARRPGSKGKRWC